MTVNTAFGQRRSEYDVGIGYGDDVGKACDVIRQAGQEIPAVLIRMADVLGQLASVLRPGAAREAVVRHLGRLAETAEAARLAPCDRNAVLLRLELARIATSAHLKEGNIHVV